MFFKNMMTGLIVLDGANATGKSYLSKYLQEKIPNSIEFHQVYRFKNRIFDFQTAVLRLALRRSTEKLVILNRLWMSEAVYASVYRTGTPWPHQGRMVDRVLMKACALQIICVDDDGIRLAERFNACRTTRSDIGALNNHKVNVYYRRLFTGEKLIGRLNYHYLDDLIALGVDCRLDFVKYQPTTILDDDQEFITHLSSRLQMLKSSQLPGATLNDNFLGHLSERTRYVFAGDTPKSAHRWSWPFYQYANSSLWFARQLHEILFDESLAVWTNVNLESSTLKKIVKLQPNIRIISLGEYARRTVDKELPMHSNHRTIPHPQYGRRFMSDGSAYRKDLLEALA